MIKILRVPECYKILRRYVKPEHQREFDTLFCRVEDWINVRNDDVVGLCDVGDAEYILDLLGTVRTVLGELREQFQLFGGTAAFVFDSLVVMETTTDLLTTHLIADARQLAKIRLRFTPTMSIAAHRVVQADSPLSSMSEWVMRLLESMGTTKDDAPMYDELGEVEREQCWAWGEYLELIQLMIPNDRYDLVLSNWGTDGVTLEFKRA